MKLWNAPLTAACMLLAFPGAALAGQSLVPEVEPNGTAATATPLGGTNVVRVGNISPGSDVDFYSFTASAGDRVYVATMTSASASATDTVLDLFGTDGVTLIETDDNDGTMSVLASSIAGTVIPVAGTYYIRVRSVAGGEIRPYHLHFRLQNGSPVAEDEPNGGTPQVLPASGWISGSFSSGMDVDLYSLALNAGDSVFLSVDADPERDFVEPNPMLGVGPFGDGAGQFLVASDAGGPGPDSEALFITVKMAGTYLVRVTPTPPGLNGTYHLSVSVHPTVSQGVNCTTYTSASVPATIPDLGTAISTLAVPGHPRAADLDVSIQLNHSSMPDLDVELASPQGNLVGLFTDVGSATQVQMDLTLDDEAAFPMGQSIVVKGMASQPELSYRLSWLDGEDAGGVWILRLHDDTAGGAGTLTAWSLTICEAATTCAGTPVTLYESDFESNAGGFTHSGAGDEWARGLPLTQPIVSCNSGSSCWKTDLAGTYDANSSQDLVSPGINLAGIPGAITASWAQKYQMENALLDHAYVDVREVGGANARRLFEWRDATMTDAVGNPPEMTQESSGWSLMTADISAFGGANVELLFHLDSNPLTELAGLAIDDVKVTWCCTVAACDDANACTTDSCDPSGCVHAPAMGEVSDATFAADKQTISWSGIPLAGRYDVLRGGLSALPVGPGGADETCFNNLPSTSLSDTDVPAAGTGFWYVVRGEGGCGTGPYGTTSGGSPRVSTTCP